MDREIRILDDSTVDSVKTYSGIELAHMLCPDAAWGYKSVMSSPFRNDSNPSLSWFRGRGGVWCWKDQGTGDGGDNIEFYRRLNPGLSYVDAVDSLSWMVLGRSAIKDYTGRKERPAYLHRATKKTVYKNEKTETKLHVVRDLPLDSPEVPEEMREYWRSRAIPDEVMYAMARYIQFENLNYTFKKTDESSGLDILDKDGRNIYFHPTYEAIGLYNDIGEISLRIPDGLRRGKLEKTSTKSFISTILNDYSRPVPCVRFEGDGDGRIHFIRYDESSRRIYVNPTQAFEGMDERFLPFAVPFLDEWKGRVVAYDDVSKMCAVLSSLCCPVHHAVIVVEGAFDGFSKFALQNVNKNRTFASDLVVLNSVNNARWAVPFLSRHRFVYVMTDNDKRSKAGQSASEYLIKAVGEYTAKVGNGCHAYPMSHIFEPYKDLNELLMGMEGKTVPNKEEKSENKDIKKAIGKSLD